MLYRLRPDRTADWVGGLGGDVFGLVDTHGGDLDRLDWAPADRVADDVTLRLALRSGRPSRVGVIVAAVDLVVRDHPERVREAHSAVVALRPTYRKTLEKMGSVMPGTLAAEDASNRAVDESIAESLARADAALEAALRAEPKSDLVEHWRSLGGILPDPL